MLLDIGAWALILGIAYVGGDGVLALLGAHDLRRGDRFILAAWLGVVALSALLLGASLVLALSPRVATACAVIVCAVGGLLRWRFRDPSRRTVRSGPRWEMALGVGVIFIGAAALASDPVTLYDSLVYHVGMIRWLREDGTVPGIALLHNRLGHVSAWFALAAPFETGVLAGRSGNIAQGVAFVLVALQGAIAAGRIGARRAVFADWFLLVLSAALILPVVVFDVATPSPDAVTNVLIAMVAWSMLIVPRVGASARASRHAINPRLVPFTLGVGAAVMKLFALPAAAAAAIFYTLGSADAATIRNASRRLAVCVVVGFAILSPFLAANVVASGCPVFPSPIACVDVGWSVGTHEAADYSEYIRNVARFQSRHSFVDAAKLPWIGHWVAKSPIVASLIVLSPIVVAVLLRGPRRDGVRSALLVAMMGVGFTLWQAPAPRFLYTYVVIGPALLAAWWVTSSGHAGTSHWVSEAGLARMRLSGTIAFVSYAVLASAYYALASQKLNLKSFITGAGRLVVVHRSEVFLPAAAEMPPRLYQWRVNDIDLFTPVPRPVADTLSYRSTIDADAGLEKCSIAPLPCTPYLPGRTVRLRVPTRGIRGGFVVADTQPAGEPPRCVGAVVAPFALVAPPRGDPQSARQADHCREASPVDRRSHGVR